MARLAEYGPDWVEEPIPVDAARTDWEALRRASGIAIAGGENFAGTGDFDSASGYNVPVALHNPGGAASPLP